MEIKDLSEVSNLTAQLSKAIDNHNAMMGLTNTNGGNWGLHSRAFISLGGDHYGNGTMHKMELVIKDSPELVRVCRKLQSEAWGKVVSIRASLRSLGVVLDGEDNNND